MKWLKNWAGKGFIFHILFGENDTGQVKEPLHSVHVNLNHEKK